MDLVHIFFIAENISIIIFFLFYWIFVPKPEEIMNSYKVDVNTVIHSDEPLNESKSSSSSSSSSSSISSPPINLNEILIRKDYTYLVPPTSSGTATTTFSGITFNGTRLTLNDFKEANNVTVNTTIPTPTTPIQGTAQRFDIGKPRFSLIPPYPLEEVAKVLTMGALKYSDRNWEKGMKWTRCIDSLERHLNAFKKGENVDPESGLPHLAHVCVNSMFLLQYEKTYPQGDDRKLSSD